MDRFSSKEEVFETDISIAKDIIYSDGTTEDKVRQIAQELNNERKQMVNDLERCMSDAVYIDRQFIEEWIENYHFLIITK